MGRGPAAHRAVVRRVATRRLTLALTALGVLLGLGLEVEASCALPRVITTGNSGSGFKTPGSPFSPTAVPPCDLGGDGGTTYPCGGGVTYNARGVFWSFWPAPGGGDPHLGQGNDSGFASGGYPAIANWFFLGYYNPVYGTLPARFGYGGLSHWNSLGIDGCIDRDGTSPVFDRDQCMAALVTDDDGRGRGYFALLSVGPTPGGDYDFSRVAGSGAILLAPIPRPVITHSVRLSRQAVDVSLTVPRPLAEPAAGLFLGCRTEELSAARYQVYVRDTPRGEPFPQSVTSRDPLLWSLAAGPAEVGESVTVRLQCGGQNRDFVLCTTLLFPAGNGKYFESGYCSANSTRIECGPSLAEPQPVRPARPGVARPRISSPAWPRSR